MVTAADPTLSPMVAARVALEDTTGRVTEVVAGLERALAEAQEKIRHVVSDLERIATERADALTDLGALRSKHEHARFLLGASNGESLEAAVRRVVRDRDALTGGRPRLAAIVAHLATLSDDHLIDVAQWLGVKPLDAPKADEPPESSGPLG